jgi:uncharacterized protein DUF4190
MVLGIVGLCVSLLFVGGLIGIVGLILSIRALNVCKRDQLPGRGMAIAGLVTSILAIVLNALEWVSIAAYAATRTTSG